MLRRLHVVFLELVRKQHFTKEQLDVQPDYFKNFSEANPQPIEFIGLKHINLKKASQKIAKALAAQEKQPEISQTEMEDNAEQLSEVKFAHLHNHSQFSILQSTASVQDIVKAAAEHKMPAVAMTDMANMMGAFHFVKAVKSHNAFAKAENAKLTEAGEVEEHVPDESYHRM